MAMKKNIKKKVKRSPSRAGELTKRTLSRYVSILIYPPIDVYIFEEFPGLFHSSYCTTDGGGDETG